MNGLYVIQQLLFHPYDSQPHLGGLHLDHTIFWVCVFLAIMIILMVAKCYWPHRCPIPHSSINLIKKGHTFFTYIIMSPPNSKQPSTVFCNQSHANQYCSSILYIFAPIEAAVWSTYIYFLPLSSMPNPSSECPSISHCDSFLLGMQHNSLLSSTT